MKKNGFTLIELLATLVILSIVITVSVIGFNTYIANTSQTYYKNLENTTRDAVIDFFADNRNFLPKQVGATRELDIQELINKNYLEQIVDTKKKKCTGKAIVLKKEANQYDYKICITCPSRTDQVGDGCN